MFQKLSNDLILHISFKLNNIEELICFSMTNKQLYKYFTNEIFSYWGKQFYNIKLINNLPILYNTSYNVKNELIRLHHFINFQKNNGHELWNNKDIFIYLNNLNTNSIQL